MKSRLVVISVRYQEFETNIFCHVLALDSVIEKQIRWFIERGRKCSKNPWTLWPNFGSLDKTAAAGSPSAGYRYALK